MTASTRLMLIAMSLATTLPLEAKIHGLPDHDIAQRFETANLVPAAAEELDLIAQIRGPLHIMTAGNDCFVHARRAIQKLLASTERSGRRQFTLTYYLALLTERQMIQNGPTFSDLGYDIHETNAYTGLLRQYLATAQRSPLSPSYRAGEELYFVTQMRKHLEAYRIESTAIPDPDITQAVNWFFWRTDHVATTLERPVGVDEQLSVQLNALVQERFTFWEEVGTLIPATRLTFNEGQGTLLETYPDLRATLDGSRIAPAKTCANGTARGRRSARVRQ